jgi:hypothetical protein
LSRAFTRAAAAERSIVGQTKQSLKILMKISLRFGESDIYYRKHFIYSVVQQLLNLPSGHWQWLSDANCLQEAKLGDGQIGHMFFFCMQNGMYRQQLCML